MPLRNERERSLNIPCGVIPPVAAVSYTHLDVYKRQGEDSVTPFLTYEGKWVIMLALTSNKGSHDVQLTEEDVYKRQMKQLFTIYSKVVIPLLGKCISKDNSAYT